ncbi:MAG TPA: TIGR00730 family Rossman fold protein [Anaeromyxobacteraceae bacterium]|nr:TIGR00730 family Rossman fold protein [Anaeromyxobacteraceae bacterium]
MKDVCVFCGSSNGQRPAYARAARRFGSALAAHGLGLVYGGGHIGLMGVVADAALAGGSRVVGVIPRSLARREIAHHGLTRLEVVPSMHARKARMAALSDAFVALPGGIGTFEELFEILTWGYLGIHAKPIGLLDVSGYYRPLVRLLDHAVEEGFLRPAHRKLVVVDRNPERLIARLGRHHVPPATRWIDEKEA